MATRTEIDQQIHIDLPAHVRALENAWMNGYYDEIKSNIECIRDIMTATDRLIWDDQQQR